MWHHKAAILDLTGTFVFAKLPSYKKHCLPDSEGSGYQEEHRMSESRRFKRKWTEPELTVILDMYVNGGLTDSHKHDAFAKCLGRYNPNTRSFSDGAVNQKLAEIKGILEASRSGRHPGGRIQQLIEKYRNRPAALRTDAVTAWRDICREYDGRPPQYVSNLIG
jgi:hypothetical protein